MKKIVGLWVLYLSTTVCAFSQVDTSFIYNTNMPYGTLDLRLAKSATRYYYLQEDITFSYRESSPGVKTNTYVSMTNWNTSAYGQGNLREVNGSSDNFVMNYRLLKPKNYNASYSPGYPIIIMFHGGGEAANCWIDTRCHWATASYNPVTNSPPAPTNSNHNLLNNDRNLLHGGAAHLNAVNLAGSKLPDDPTLAARAFPGFVLFPQTLNGWGPSNTVQDAIRILRLIIKKYNIDESRVYIHGLSNGGGGVYNALKRAPWLFAAAIPMSAVNDGGIINQGFAPEVGKLPLWIFQGGQDNNPTPGKTYGYVRGFTKAGGSVRYYLYPNLGHGTWNTAYNQPDFFTWMLSKRKYNPHIFFGEPIICNTTQTGVRMGFSKGYFAYQWQRDGHIIQGENDAEITANTPGTYHGRFSRKPNPSEADWERWSDPIVVSEMNPVKPVVEVIGTAHLRGPGLSSTDENNTVKLRSAQSAELYNWYKDGQLVNFPGTNIEDTLRLATFTNGSSGSNGAYTLVTNNSNCPSRPSDPVNLFFNNSSPQDISISSGSLDFNGTVTSSSIFLSWNDVSGLETGYEIWRRKAGTSDFVFVTKTKEDAVSYQDTHLNPGTVYEYKIRAVNNTSRSNYLPSEDPGNNYRFTTAGDFHFPLPPQDLKVVTNTLNTITLSWKAAKDENSVKEYHIYYKDDVVNTGSNATTYTLTGLPRNTAFPIYVKAVDHANHFSQASNQIIATTYLTGLIYKHSTGAWESLNDSAIVATWESPEFTGVVPNFTLQPRTQEDYFNFQYTGYLNIETEDTYFFSITSDDGSRLFLNGDMIIDNDGLHGTRTINSEGIYLSAGPHPVEVQYFDDVGGHNLTVRYRGPGIGDGTNFVTIPDAALRSGTYNPPQAPGAPSGVTANGVGMERIDIQWQYSDNEQTDYEVYRATSTQGPFEIVARVAGTNARDSIGLIPDTQYYYKVKTVNTNGSSGFSAVVSASTMVDHVAPTVPLELVEISKTLTTLAFSWKASTDNVGVTGYEIFSDGELMGTSDMHAFMADDLEANTQYHFTVKATDASGNRSGASEPLVVVTTNSDVFYSLATGNLNDLSTWHSLPDGSGESPANFSDNGQYFMIMNRTHTSLGGPWTIGGSSSRVIIPTGVTLTVDHPFSARVELQGTAMINLNHETPPVFSKLSSTSTVNFNAPASIAGNTYGNIILSGTESKTFEADTITVLGNLTIHEGLAFKGAPQNQSHIRISGNLTLSGTRAATAADNGVDVAFVGGVPQSLVSGSDLYLYRIITSANTRLNVDGDADTPVKINVGSLKGGGLLLANGSMLNLADNDLAIDHAGVINPKGQGGRISISGSNVSITTTSDENTNLYFDPSTHLVNHLHIDLSGAGNVAVREPLQIAEGIKIRNGTLEAGGYITLLSTASQTAVIYEIGNTGSITGEVAVQQHLEPRGIAYRYLSPPVSGVTVSKWQGSFPVTGQFTGASTGAGLNNSPSLFYYQTNEGWVAHPPSGGSNTAPIEKGRGYAALLRNNTNPITAQVQGNPFQGSISFPLEEGSEGLNPSGWNLIGNPYASPILWNDDADAWTHSGINNVVAVCNDRVINGQKRTQVIYYDKLLGGGVLPAGEAFWVKTFNASPALVIHEKAKVNTETDVVAPVSHHLIVNLKQGDISDPAYLLFTTAGTDGYDAQYDGRKMNNEGMFNFSTITEDTVLLAVNNLTNVFCTKTIRLNIADVEPGSYAFSFENWQWIESMGELVLTDHYTGSSEKINGAEYPFSVTAEASSFGPDRFSLIFKKTDLDITTPQVSADDICAPDTAYVSIANSQPGVAYYVMNADGKIISSETEGNGETVVLEIFANELSPGANQIRISAGFAGCERQMLAAEATLNYASELSVNADDVSVCVGADAALEASGAPDGGFYRWFNGDGEIIEGAHTATLAVSEVNTESVYYVTTVHSNGCESERRAIHIYADTLDAPVILMKEDTMYTEVVGHYQWHRYGTPVPDATLHYYVPSENGSYTVVASNGGCFKESKAVNIDDDGNIITGVDDVIDPEFVMNIYPVPSGGHTLNIIVRSPKKEPVLIEIIDTMGRLHYSNSYDMNALGNGMSIVPNVPLYNGIYFIRATQAEIKARQKIIVKD